MLVPLWLWLSLFFSLSWSIIICSSSSNNNNARPYSCCCCPGPVVGVCPSSCSCSGCGCGGGRGCGLRVIRRLYGFSLFLSPRLVGANQRMVCTPFSGLASQTYRSSRRLFVPLVQPIVAPDTIADLFSLGTSWCPSSIFAPIYFSS